MIPWVRNDSIMTHLGTNGERNRTPDSDEQAGGPSHLWSSKQRLDMIRTVLGVLGKNVTPRSRRRRVPVSSWRLQLFHRQRCCLAIVFGQLVNDLNCFCVPADARQESWTFEEGKDEEAEAPEEEGEPAKCKDKVSPPHIVGLFAIIGRGTREIGDQGPRDLYRAYWCIRVTHMMRFSDLRDYQEVAPRSTRWRVSSKGTDGILG